MWEPICIPRLAQFYHKLVEHRREPAPLCRNGRRNHLLYVSVKDSRIRVFRAHHIHLVTSHPHIARSHRRRKRHDDPC